jgi:putative FmdB family regulatory protein
MPIYEYECNKCGHEFEALILKNTPEPACPKCKSKKLKQLITMFAVSSESTRASNLAAARKRAQVVHKDKQVAEQEAIRAHYEDHYPPPEKKKKKK